MGRIPLSPGLATLRVPFPCPLAAGALANDLKLTALRPLGFSRTSPYRSKLLTALHEKSPAHALSFKLFAEREALELILSQNIIKLQTTDNQV